MNNQLYKYGMIENAITMLCCAICVTGLAAFTDGNWGWGFLILINLNTFSSKS